jgi:PPIC-type PPIASE domain
MSRRFLLLGFLPVVLSAQKPTPSVVNGHPVSQAELDSILKLAPAELKSVVLNNPEELLRYYGTVDRLAELAEKQHLADESPTKEQLMVARKQVLADALTNHYFSAHPVLPEDEKKYYETHLDDFTVAHIKGLCVPIATAAEATSAQAKAEQLAQQLRDGADFTAVAAKYPLPQGIPNTISQTDKKIPDAIRALLFVRKPGEFTPPIPTPNGVYIFRVDKIETKPFSEARVEANNLAGLQAFSEWLEGVRKTVDVKLGSR